MAINNPVAVFVAETNVEAHVIANLLKDSGNQAHAVEDISPAGMYSLGTLDEIHRPTVFVSPDQLDAAREIIARYQSSANTAAQPASEPCCYFCGAACEPKAAKCLSCGQTLEWDQDEVTIVNDSGRKPPRGNAVSLDLLRNTKRLLALILLAPIVLYVGLVLVAALMGLLSRFGK